ncbi:AprI/Inh family metalloprotease inhibitor [Chelatococcus sp. SYSU_G07232]|uniref:AprI/Inh family metalloprotease inhibitor n=1 Tax=Chelatococcus albus TaxID=3047466 RepID=A0ABT7AD98_9HYPH|nr:AprI/Inh family metalloprotease inhibitor [Chelatococcus sp. SYSU_G07232]MDJ1157350.1 AprI/Inh family metalloprotease inhibitor [Chelatococcus sp. SYSU_G07232]
MFLPRAAAPRVARALLILPVMFLAACAGSSRFGSGPYASGPAYPPSGGYGAAPRASAPPPDDYEPAPAPGSSSAVIASPLPPAPGTVVAAEPPAPPPAGSQLGGTPGPVASLGTPSGAQSPAGAAAAAPASRTSVTGTWTAREATGGSCKVSLSSSPALDRYRASTSGCANQDLKAVNAWDLRDGEVYLFSRDTVVARLKGGGGGFSGVIAKSGAPLSISR